ncbi:hypothetical protein ONE63_003051 [Megalurothrips usitatus]|uniref:Cytochrome P450 4C1-like n=1 Tax=Megalurothrips usitatus TaxID=439358 RepID=A0AAV7XCP7_9NEOP|nr:hypothetical protein ONE63_003051 [Megalurothrips usitatus]
MSAAVLLFVALAAVVVSRVVLAVLRFRRVELAFDGEPSLPVLGNSLAFLGATEDDVFYRIRGLWGGRRHVTRMSLLGHLILIVSDPDDIEKVFRGKDTQDKSRIFYQFLEYISRNGLVTINGAEWRTHRKALTPAFHGELLDKYQEVFDEEAKGFLARVRPGVAHDVMPSLKTGSARAFFRTALTTDITGDAADFFPVMMEVLEAFPRTMTFRSFQPWFWTDATFGLTSLGRHVTDLIAKVDLYYAKKMARKEMARVRSQLHRKGHEEDFIKERPTLIEILLQDSDSPLPDRHIMDEPDRHIMDELIIFTGAAIETTVASLGWTFKTLSLRPDVQDRILEEVDEVVGQAGAVLPEHLPRLEYTERVIKESLRLTPAVPMLARGNLHAATTFNGKHVPKGSTFLVNMLGAHRDPRHWEEPLKFDPDRWLPERSQGRHHYAYMPFSAGPRNCIGGRYAMAVMKTLLANVLPRYRVDPVDDGLTDPATFPMSFGIASQLPGGVHVVFTPRQPSAA